MVLACSDFQKNFENLLNLEKMGQQKDSDGVDFVESKDSVDYFGLKAEKLEVNAEGFAAWLRLQNRDVGVVVES